MCKKKHSFNTIHETNIHTRRKRIAHFEKHESIREAIESVGRLKYVSFLYTGVESKEFPIPGPQDSVGVEMYFERKTHRIRRWLLAVHFSGVAHADSRTTRVNGSYEKGNGR